MNEAFLKETELRAYGERRLPDILEFLREMVGINSFTENAAGVNQLGERIAREFALLGFQSHSVQAACADYGRHLVLRREALPAAPTIALISHLDTVFTIDEEKRNNFAWRQEGRRIYGPGTNDIKGGTASIFLLLSTIKDLFADTFYHVNWIVLHNACEEVIGKDFGDLCRSELPPDTLACLVFEADGADDEGCQLVSGRKGRATFQIQVEGRGAHAGSQHHRGANAVVQLARTICAIDALTNYSDELTVNIGSVSGGTVANRVPHLASANLEMRAFDPSIYERAKEKILSHSGEVPSPTKNADSYPCRVSVDLETEASPWPSNENTQRLLRLWQDAGNQLGLNVLGEKRGGLSDGNVLWDIFPTLDGLGPRGENSHCSEFAADGSKEPEWVDATSFVPKNTLNVTAILHLLKTAHAHEPGR